VLRPGDIALVEPPVQLVKGSLLALGQLMLRDDDEVHVAVLVGVADCERSLQVRATEVVSERGSYVRHELGEQPVELRVRRPRHPPIACTS
jgi:hypothetical protein